MSGGSVAPIYARPLVAAVLADGCYQLFHVIDRGDTHFVFVNENETPRFVLTFLSDDVRTIRPFKKNFQEITPPPLVSGVVELQPNEHVVIVGESTAERVLVDLRFTYGQPTLMHGFYSIAYGGRTNATRSFLKHGELGRELPNTSTDQVLTEAFLIPDHPDEQARFAAIAQVLRDREQALIAGLSRDIS